MLMVALHLLQITSPDELLQVRMAREQRHHRQASGMIILFALFGSISLFYYDRCNRAALQ